MKEQDAYINPEKHPLIMYVEKPDGSYGTLQTEAFMVNNYLDDFMAKARAIEAAARERIESTSPVAYWQAVRGMTVEDIGGRTGFSKGTVLKHQSPEGFEKLTIAQARTYAEVFGVPLEHIVQIPPQQTINQPTTK